MIKIIFQYFFKDFWQRVAFFGRNDFFLFVTFFLVGFGFYEIGIKLFVSLFISYFIVSILRVIFFRERPIKKKYSNIFEKIDASSFPSFHSVRSSILFFMFFLSFQNYFLWLIFFTITIFVSFGRLVLKRHYLNDVFVGLFLGFFVYFLVDFIFISLFVGI